MQTVAVNTSGNGIVCVANWVKSCPVTTPCVVDSFTDSIVCVAELPKSPEWKSSSDPGKDERFESESEGKQIRLDCRAKGKPTPKVTWFKDGQIISPDNDRIQVSEVVAGMTEVEMSEAVVGMSEVVVEMSEVEVSVVVAGMSEVVDGMSEAVVGMSVVVVGMSEVVVEMSEIVVEMSEVLR